MGEIVVGVFPEGFETLYHVRPGVTSASQLGDHCMVSLIPGC